jgi:hypothetical protein
MPLTWETLRAGIPTLAILGLAHLARYLGLGSLREPRLYLLLVQVGHDFPDPTPPAEPPHRRPRRQPELERNVGWFYEHFCEGRSAVANASSHHYDIETVEAGIRQARRLLGVKKRAGRPPLTHYAA